MIDRQRVYNWHIGLVAAVCMVSHYKNGRPCLQSKVSAHWLDYFNHPDKNELGLINTSYTIGGIISGWFPSGPVADLFGRRWGMAIGCLLTIVATFIQNLAPYHALSAFIVGRVIIGFGQGIAITAGPIYIGEVTPPHIRGKLMAFWRLFYSVGSFIASWINYATALHRDTLGEWDWKMVVIFQLLLPIIIVVQLPFMPETPRWLISRHNDVDTARAALLRVRASAEEVEDEILSIRGAIQYEKETTESPKKAYLALFKDASIRKRLLLVMIINIGQQLSGQGTLNGYSSTIYTKVFQDVDTINLINALNATFGIIFTLTAVWTVDRFGRKFLFIIGAIGMAMCTMIIAVVGLTTPDVNKGTKSHVVGIAIAFLAFLFIIFCKPSWGATTWTYTAEVFPMHVRAQALSMCVQMQNVANTIFQQFFPTFYTNCGLKTFFFFMTTNILLAAYVWLFIPETKQVPLEQMDTLFGGVNHVEKGSDMLETKETGVELVEAPADRAVRTA